MISENGHGDLPTDCDQDIQLKTGSGSASADRQNTDDNDGDFTDSGSYASDSDASFTSYSTEREGSLVDFVNKGESSPWELPPSSKDLLLPNEHLFGALEVYELCRHFSQSLQLSPFLFESFCAALMCRNQSSLLDNIHLALLRAIFRDEDSSETQLVPQDSTGHLNQTLFVLDRNTYGEVLRRYLESDQRFPSDVLYILENGSYPFVEISQRLTVLLWLSERVLQTQVIRDKVQNSEGVSKNDDHCRDCGKFGDLLCCTTCSAVYHLRCLPEGMKIDNPSTWRCSICLKHELPGVTDCLFPWEAAGTYVQAEPWGYDSHGRRFWFIARRLFVEDDVSGVVYYYSTLPQFYELVKCFQGGKAEEELCYQFLEFFDVIEYQLILNEVLTKKARDNIASWFELNAESRIDEPECTNGQTSRRRGKFCRRLLETVERALERRQQRIEDQCAKESKKDYVDDSEFASMPSLSLVDSGINVETDFYDSLGSAFKLGMEGTFMSYTNHYLEDPYAKSPYQRAEEHRKYKYISEKFHVDEEGQFKWPCGFSRSEESIILMLRQSLHDLCLRFPETLMHPLWWKEQRVDWFKTLDNAERLETLINHLAQFELLMRPLALVEVWYQGLGYSRLWRQTAADREERNNQKAKAKEQQALDEPNENAIFAKYTMLNSPPKHQIWKLKHEQYRISGDGRLGGWIWIRRQPHTNPASCPTRLFRGQVVESSQCKLAVNKLIMDFGIGLRCSPEQEQEHLRMQIPHVGFLASKLLSAETDASLEGDAVRPHESPVSLHLSLHSPLVNVSEGIRVHSVYFKKAKECAPLDSLLNTLECKREVQPFVAVQRGVCDSRASCYSISCRVFGRYACYSPSCLENFSASRFHLLGFGGRKRVEVEQPQTNVSSFFPPEPVHLMYRCCENEEPNILNVSQNVLMRLARRGPDDELDGFNCTAKAGWNWMYPSPRPTVQTCWRLATQRAPSLHSVAFLVRSFYMSIRWNELLVKMPLQTKHVLKSESYNESREIIQHKDLPPFGLCCTYMTRYHRLADDLRCVNFLSSSELDEDDFASPEYSPASSSSLRRSSPRYSPWQLRKRKQKELQQADGLSDRFVWHDESIFLFWEVKNYWTLQKRNYFMEKERDVNGLSGSFVLSRRNILTKPAILLSTSKPSGNSVALKSVSVTSPNLRVAPVKAGTGAAFSENVRLLFPKPTTVSKTTGPPMLTSVSPVKVVPSICRKPCGSSSSAVSLASATPKAPLVMLRLADGRTVLSRAPAASREAAVGNVTVAAVSSNAHAPNFVSSRLAVSAAGNPMLQTQAVPASTSEEYGIRSSSKVTAGKLVRAGVDNDCFTICRNVLLQIVNKVVENERRQKLARRHRISCESRRIYWKKYRLRAKAKQVQSDSIQCCMRQWRVAQRLGREKLKSSIDNRVTEFFSKLKVAKPSLSSTSHRKVGKLLAPVMFKRERVHGNLSPTTSFSSKGLRIPFPLRRLPPKRPVHVTKRPVHPASTSQRRIRFTSFPVGSAREAPLNRSLKKHFSLGRASKVTKAVNDFLEKKVDLGKSLSKNDFYCAYCSSPYNSKKFYIACSLCSRWFHGGCVGVTEAQSKRMVSWHCRDCQNEREKTVQELHCICRTPYDESRPYVCCDACEGWFHCGCVGLTAEAAEAIPLYVCKICKEKREVNAMVKQLTSDDYGKLEKLVLDLLEHKMSWPFRGTYSGNSLPSHDKLHPDILDLSSILVGVMRHDYCTLSDFAVDMAKVFNGVRNHYGTNASEFQCANVIEALFTEKLRSIKATLL